MTELPTHAGMTPEQAFERLQNWFQKQAQLKVLKSHEHLERVALSDFYFPHAQEGTNRLALGAGFDLKLQHGYNYKVSEEDLDQVAAADIKKLKLPWDDLFVYKPELSIKTYRTLTAEQKKFVDGILDIKPASPQLDIVKAADKAGQQEHIEAAASVVPDDGLVVVLEAEKAEIGQYYCDGDNWWCLNDELEWDEVLDPDLVGRLAAQLAEISPPAKSRRRRSSK